MILEPPSADGSSNQLIAVTVRLVASHFKVGEETFYRFVKSNVVSSQFISFKVVFKVSRDEAMPIDQCLFCRMQRVRMGERPPLRTAPHLQ